MHKMGTKHIHQKGGGGLYLTSGIFKFNTIDIPEKRKYFQLH